MARYLILVTLMAILLLPGLAKAQQDVSDAFAKYSNPHSICNYYRSNGYAIDRESDNECLTSLGEGQLKTYTQYYYSGDNWCYKVIQQGQTYHQNCIAIPKTTKTGNYTPFIVVGAVIFGLIVVAGASSGGAKAKAAVKSGKGSYGWETTETSTTNSEPVTAEEAIQEEETHDDSDAESKKPKRSGKGSYGWEEIETSTTESGVDSIQGPGEGQSTGGVGLHQGEPIVNSTANELEKLARLKEKGVITRKEFNLAKKKLLK